MTETHSLKEGEIACHVQAIARDTQPFSLRCTVSGDEPIPALKGDMENAVDSFAWDYHKTRSAIFSALMSVAPIHPITELWCTTQASQQPTGSPGASRLPQWTGFFQQRESHDYESKPRLPLVMLSWKRVYVLSTYCTQSQCTNIQT